MSKLSQKTVVITGASRGIGRAIALICAKDGANVVLASKSTEPHKTLAGTLHTVADEVKAAGGTPLVVGCDVRIEEDVEKVMSEAHKAFGGIDVLVNNAGAINLQGVDSLPMKRFDLMQGVNARAVFLCTQKALPHLQQSGAAGRHPHILNLSPPMTWDARWHASNEAYTLSKFGMSLLTKVFSESLKDHHIAVNSLWPRTAIATAAVEMLLGEEGSKASRTPDIMADAAYAIITTEGRALTGEWLLDEDLLKSRGVVDFERYLTTPGVEPVGDFYV
jgi:citronellol/citronellal dehydrogenase